MTPMMRQYSSAKAKAGDAVLLFRMGDFYELFYEDARLVSRILGLTLTARSKGDDAIPMAGFPVKAVNSYIRKLLDLGHRVAICEQMEDPAAAKGIVERDIVRVVTPGTVTEDEVLSAKDENHLAALAVERDRAGLAWIDLSTGRFHVQDVSLTALSGELSRISPSEILLPDTAADPDSSPLEGQAQALDCMITRRPPWTFERGQAVSALTEHFGVRSLEGFGVSEDGVYVGPAGAVLHYLQETQKTSLGHVLRIRRHDPGDLMLLDGPTRRSLELTRSMAGGRDSTLLSVLDSTRTAMGGRLMKSWVLNPLVSVSAIVERQQGVGELVEGHGLREDLGEAVENIHDIERIAARVATGRAGPRDLGALGRSLSRLPALKEVLDRARAPVLTKLGALPLFEDLAALLKRALHPSPPLALGEGGIIRQGYNEELDELLSVAQEGKGWIARFQAEEMERTGIPTLKVGYNRVFGYYIEVTNPHRDKVPEAYTRKQTLKNAERYITEELKEYEVKVLTADERSKKLEQRLFLELRDQCAVHVEGLQRAAAAVAQADGLLSLALAAVHHRYVRPQVTDELVLSIQDGRHPVLETLMDPGSFVPNDVHMDEGARVIVITGPNMAGKSTYIRQVALLVLMAQVGSFLPCTSATVGVTDRIFTRTGASDEIARGLSTFMVEMNETANILNNATERSMVILDEVGRGTSTFDGVSIAWAVTEHLSSCIGARTLFATHYHELTELSLLHGDVKNFHVSVKEWGERLVFVHKIAPGGVDKSYGIHVARLAGIPPTVIERARAILDRLEGQSVNAEMRPSFAPVEEAEDAVQLTLFATLPSRTLEALAAIDIDTLSPVEALIRLKELRDQAREETT